jgi:hypothetical protein
MKTKITAMIGIVLLSHSAIAQEKTTIRFGHFPNITHAQGVIAHALSRQGKGLGLKNDSGKRADSVVLLTTPALQQ